MPKEVKQCEIPVWIVAESCALLASYKYVLIQDDIKKGTDFSDGILRTKLDSMIDYYESITGVKMPPFDKTY